MIKAANHVPLHSGTGVPPVCSQQHRAGEDARATTEFPDTASGVKNVDRYFGGRNWRMEWWQTFLLGVNAGIVLANVFILIVYALMRR